MSDDRTTATPLTEWLRENAPDCGDNSCLFGGRGKGGMRTNGGCRCFKDLPTAKRIYVERLFAYTQSSAEGDSIELKNLREAYARACVKVISMGAASFGTLDEGLDNLASLIPSATSDRTDAERYRWLRQNGVNCPNLIDDQLFRVGRRLDQLIDEKLASASTRSVDEWPWVCFCGVTDPRDCDQPASNCSGGRQRPASTGDKVP